jgi:hypothetical protein
VRRIAAFIAAGITVGSVVACGTGDNSDPYCAPHPCPVPLAVQLRVSSAAGGPVPGLTVALIGSRVGSVQCIPEVAWSRCPVLGDAGTYLFRIAAQGFRTVELAVVVPGSDMLACTCPTVQTQQVDVVLVPS